MMADSRANDIAFEAAFNATILAGISPAATTDPIRAKWNAVMAEYLRLETLAEADRGFGEYFLATAAYDGERADLEHEFGKGYKSHPAGAIRANMAFDALSCAEERRQEIFLRPLWEAEEGLGLTPAPDLQAAMFKLVLIKRHDLRQNATFPARAMAVIREDMARLTRQTRHHRSRARIA
jgi:hypothetical protein